MDSLAWPVPHNLISELEDNLLMLEGKLGIDIHSCVQDNYYHHSSTLSYRHLDQCTHLYPLQTSVASL